MRRSASLAFAVASAWLLATTPFGAASFLHPPVGRPAGAAAVTSYSYVSSPGDWIGQGQSGTLTPPSAAFSLGAPQPGHATFGVIGIAITTATEQWTMSVSSAYNAQLHTGTYSNTSNSNGNGPYFTVYSSRGCNNFYTTFTIFHMSSDTTGAINVFDAAFTQRCESPTAPPLIGRILYKAPPAAALQLTSTYPSSVFGQPVTFSAVATGQGPRAPTGTVSFQDGGNSLGVAVLGASGVATLTVGRFTQGSHAILAMYSGDARNPPATSAVITQAVLDNTTSLYVTSSAGFPGSEGGTEAPTGSTDTFRVHCFLPPSNQSCFELTIDNGTWDVLYTAATGERLHPGRFSVSSSAPAGSAAITVHSRTLGCSTYGTFTIYHIVADTRGEIIAFDGSFDVRCTANPGPVWVRGLVKYHAPAPAPLTVTSSNPTTVAGEPTTFSAAVDSLGIGTPTGTVQFQDGSAPLRTVPLDAVGVATMSIAKLSHGVHGISATYSGDATHPAAGPVAVTQTVDPNHTSFYFISREGGWIGFGAQASYVPSAGTTFALLGSSSVVQVKIFSGPESWEVDLIAPTGAVLTSGTSYTNGIVVAGDLHGCDHYYGSFTVNRIVLDGSGVPSSLDASFSMNCDYPTSPAMTGVVKVNS